MDGLMTIIESQKKVLDLYKKRCADLMSQLEDAEMIIELHHDLLEKYKEKEKIYKNEIERRNKLDFPFDKIHLN